MHRMLVAGNYLRAPVQDRSATIQVPLAWSARSLGSVAGTNLALN